MIDMRTEYLGMQLKSPIVASAGPLTRDVPHIAELERFGAAAVVLPSLFEEQIEHDQHEIDRLYSVHEESFGEATSFFPAIEVASRADDYLGLISEAKAAVAIPVIASLNGTRVGGWLDYARLIEEAGADALELNLYDVAADPLVSGSAIEAAHLDVIAVVAEQVDIPVAVKISTHYSSMAAFVVAAQQAGAAGIVMFNRFYLPDLDLETLEVLPRISLSTPDELRLPMRWIGILHDHLTMSIAGSSGVHSGFDVAKLLLAGADVAMTTSALLGSGSEHLATMEQQLRDWMTEHEYESVTQMRGAVSPASSGDPTAYERANYIGNLASYTSAFLGTHSIGLKNS
jgi:dihydroorotate dehydrogenase (fumarate)